MKITIAPVIAGPAWGTEISLTTGLDKSPEGIIYNGTNVVDMVQVLESPFQIAIDRGNKASVITFTFTKDNASFVNSEHDLILYFASIPAFGKISFYAETNLESPYAYMVGSLNIRHSQIGVATIRNFTITGTPITEEEPLPPPVGPELVLFADASSADAYAVKDFGSDHGSIWVSFLLGFYPDFLAYFSTGSNSSGAFVSFLDSSDEIIGGVFLENDNPGEADWNSITPNASSGVPTAVANRWQPMEVHYVSDGSTTLCELYVRGVLSFSASIGGSPNRIRKIWLGSSDSSPSVPQDVLFIKRLKAGTTRGASDIFSDDFSSGDFSAWTSTSGSVSIIPGPF